MIISGCQTSSLYFATDTSAGLMDVSGNSKVPDKLSFGFKRNEILIIPEEGIGESNNDLQPVLSILDSDFTWFSGSRIEEAFATGAASTCAAYHSALASLGDADEGATEYLEGLGFTEANSCPVSNVKQENENTRWTVRKNNSLVFEAKTAFSVAKFSYGETEAPNVSLLNYKRRVASIIPLFDKDSQVRSVYSDFCFNSMKGADDEGHGTLVKQAYATGLAAIMVAKTAVDFGVSGSCEHQ
jgi:hypothetical protein